MTHGGCSDFIKGNREELLDRLPDPTIDYYMKSSTQMDEIDHVDLIVTSPPYPGVEMWEERFGSADQILDMIEEVLKECYDLLDRGGIVCVNIGDATYSDAHFECYPNHAEILTRAKRMGFTTLIPIHWKKPTNRPNSFLGSGFTPPNAYVTLDTEYILILRKGGTRKFDDTFVRHASRYTKAERDTWFSQTWNVKGAEQEGFATFPPEIPYRLIRMFSVLGDTILDPFTGTGTTLRVARALGRSAVGYEIDDELQTKIESKIASVSGIPMEDVLQNFIRNERSPEFGVGGFLSNTGSLLDVD